MSTVSRACAIGLLSLLAGGGIRGAGRPEPTHRTLWVSVAVSFKPAAEDAARLFEQQHEGVKVLLNAGASGVLLQQVRRGVPADLLISASPDEQQKLLEEGLLRSETRCELATNRLVILTPPNGVHPRIVHDLVRPEFEIIALGNPATAPVGRYAAAALESLGLWEELRNRFVLAESARQVVEYVARGDVAAGIVYLSDAELFGGDTVIGPRLPADAHPPILYEGAVLAGSKSPELAAAFLELLRSEAGRKILDARALSPPP